MIYLKGRPSCGPQQIASSAAIKLNSVPGLASLNLNGNAQSVSTITMPTILTYLAQGYDGGKWDGSGIISSVAASNAAQTTAIAYADSAEGLVVGLPADTIELKYALIGDTGLTGSVGFNDFTRLTQHYNQLSGGTWETGDLNYDGRVNFSDFSLMTRTYNTSLGSTAQTGITPAVTPIPEPGVSLFGIVLVALRSRPRARSRLAG